MAIIWNVVLVKLLKYNEIKYQNYQADFLFFLALFMILFKFLGQLTYFNF